MQLHIKIAELAREDLFRLLEAYQKATQESIFCSITDANGIIIYVNRIFCDVSKYSEAELVGRNHNIVNAGYHPPKFFKNLWDTITAGNTWHGEVKNRAKDGSYYWLDSVIIPIKDENGVICQYFSLRTQINDKKHVEEDRIEHIRALENMLFMISHKVRHPIANILSIVNVFEAHSNSPEEIQRMISYIKESALTLDNFTRELTGFIYELEQKGKKLPTP